MRDIPLFTTEHGAASLVLREIPCRQAAYIHLQATLEPEQLLRQCVQFCRMAGAEKIYAAGHACLERYPLHTSVLRMVCQRDSIADTNAALWPVQEDTLESFRCIYNEKTVRVDNSAWMTLSDGKEMLRLGDGYFIHRGDTLLGIGRASGEQIRWVASVQPGAGRDVVLALANAVCTDTVTLEVASTNEKAIALYESLGFVKATEVSRWYAVG